MSGLILYTSEDGASRIQLRADGQTVWLAQLEMADRFAATRQNISLCLKNLFEGGQLAEDAVVKESLTVQTGTKPRATTEDSSVDQTLGNGQVLRCAKFWNQVLLRQRLPSSVGN